VIVLQAKGPSGVRKLKAAFNNGSSFVACLRAASFVCCDWSQFDIFIVHGFLA